MITKRKIFILGNSVDITEYDGMVRLVVTAEFREAPETIKTEMLTNREDYSNGKVRFTVAKLIPAPESEKDFLREKEALTSTLYKGGVPEKVNDQEPNLLVVAWDVGSGCAQYDYLLSKEERAHISAASENAIKAAVDALGVDWETEFVTQKGRYGDEDEKFVTFRGYSDAGEDLEFTVPYDDYIDIGPALLSEYQDYDPEEHVKVLLDAKLDGTPGLFDLVEDAKWIEEFLEKLTFAVRDALNGTAANGPKEYEVKIVERLEKTVTAKADSFAEAADKVRSAWKNGDYVLGADDFAGVEFAEI